MVISKGYKVTFGLANGKAVKAPATYGMLHDPDGKDWPYCSLLIAPFYRQGHDVRDKKGEEYFNYVPRAGRREVPPRRISDWRDLGEVEIIEYTRPGDKEIPGKYNLRYDHDFKKLPHLYRRGRLLRLDLPDGCVVNWRGIVKP